MPFSQLIGLVLSLIILGAIWQHLGSDCSGSCRTNVAKKRPFIEFIAPLLKNQSINPAAATRAVLIRHLYLEVALQQSRYHFIESRLPLFCTLKLAESGPELSRSPTFIQVTPVRIIHEILLLTLKSINTPVLVYLSDSSPCPVHSIPSRVYSISLPPFSRVSPKLASAFSLSWNFIVECTRRKNVSSIYVFKTKMIISSFLKTETR